MRAIFRKLKIAHGIIREARSQFAKVIVRSFELSYAQIDIENAFSAYIAWLRNCAFFLLTKTPRHHFSNSPRQVLVVQTPTKI